MAMVTATGLLPLSMKRYGKTVSVTPKLGMTSIIKIIIINKKIIIIIKN